MDHAVGDSADGATSVPGDLQVAAHRGLRDGSGTQSWKTALENSEKSAIRELLVAVLAELDENSAKEILQEAAHLQRAEENVSLERVHEIVEGICNHLDLSVSQTVGVQGSYRRKLRYNIVAENLAFIDAFNARRRMQENSLTPFLEANAYILLSHTEFGLAMSNGLQANLTKTNGNEFLEELLQEDTSEEVASQWPVDTTWDWKIHGAVGHVKNQGFCGSCWAHSAIAAIEGKMAIQHQELFQLSAQQLLDCFRPLEYGCRGGSFLDVLRNYTTNHAILTEKRLPFVGQAAEHCLETRNQESHEGVVETENVIWFKEAHPSVVANLVRQQPVASSIKAASRCFQFYASGILDDDGCSQGDETMNHAVTIVGFEHTDDPDRRAWIIKNSWGRHWGEDGFARIKIHAKSRTSAFGIHKLIAAPLSVSYSQRCLNSSQACSGEGLAVNTSKTTPYDDGSSKGSANRVHMIVAAMFLVWVLVLICIVGRVAYRQWTRKRRGPRPRRDPSLTRASHESLVRLLDEYVDDDDDEEETGNSESRPRPYDSSII